MKSFLGYAAFSSRSCLRCSHSTQRLEGTAAKPPSPGPKTGSPAAIQDASSTSASQPSIAASSAPAPTRSFRMPSFPLLDFLEDLRERAAGRLRDPPAALALLLVGRLREPPGVVRCPALVTQRVVGGDHVRLDTGEPE